jgi:hypothetical protein
MSAYLPSFNKSFSVIAAASLTSFGQMVLKIF